MKRAVAFAVLSLLVLASLFAGALPAYQAEPTQLVLLSKLDGPPLPADLRILEDYNAFVLAEVSAAQLAALPPANIMDRMADRTVISLIGTTWDTRQGEPAIAPEMRSAPDDLYFLVQFYGPIKMEWVSNLEAMGVTFLDYYPNYAYIVRMNPALVEQVQAAHAVQWVGRYHPAYRLASDEDLSHARTDGDRLAVEVSAFACADAKAFRSGLEAAGVTVALFETREDGALMARVWAARPQLPQLAALSGVFRVEPYDPPQLTNDGATQVMHTRHLWKAGRNGLTQDLMGAGQTGGVLDSGLDINTTNPNILDFYDWTGGVKTSRVKSVTASAGCGGTCTATDDITNGGHGTHVAGSMVGNGYLSLSQRGLTGHATAADPYFDYAWAVGQAPEANLRFVYCGCSGGLCLSVPTDWTTLYNYSPNGARVTNNSWGNTTYSYGGTARSADYEMWTYQDYLLVMSAGNAGPGAGTVSQPSNAKNILSVGAVDNHRSAWSPDGQTASALTDFSSRGPIATSGDTRFKPDIAAAGAEVLSTRSTAIADTTIGLWQNEPGDGGGNGTGTLDYEWSGGTSMASPEIAGAAIIVRDYFQDIQGLGDSTPPSAALLKAALVNGAVDMGYGYEANTTAYPYGGRNMQGWGYANVEQSITPRAPRSFFYDDFTNISNSSHQSTIGMDSSGDYVQYTVVVADSSEPLKVTLTWTDYANTTTSSYAVNNLDLTVTSPGSTVYYGNNFTGAWSNTNATADTKNNTEVVYIQAPTAGTWTVRVTLANAPTGSYQPFALFVSGGLGVTPSTTRTCSGITSCTGRMGTSAQAYYPSLKPLGGSLEHLAANSAFDTTFRVTNWGTTVDTISLSSAVTTLTGAAASGFTISFSPAGPLSLASGASQDVVATVSVGSAVTDGSYDVSLIATSAGTGSRKDVQVLALNVVPEANISNQARLGAGTVSTTGAQVSSSFWVCPNTPTTMWVAYLSTEVQLGSAAKLYAARSVDNGVTWTKWQIDANDGYYYFAPAIAGSADCSSVTVAWAQERTASLWYLYSRTYSGGAWGSIGQRDTLSGTGTALGDVAVIYDRDSTSPDILLTWWRYATTTGIYYATNIDGTWGSATALVTGANHRYPALTVDTVNNHVWMAWSYSGTTRDIYVKYWNGSTNAWNGTNSSVGVASTTNRENHPAIFYVNGKLWLAWNRYTNYSAATPLVYYSYTTSTLPNLTWATAQGPYGTRVAEHTPPTITGDSSYSYIAYLTYDQTFAGATTAMLRGANIYALKVAAAGGSPVSTYQLSATVDDPPLYARGNAGSPQLQWATTTVNGNLSTGPTLVYSKNPPNSGNPDYGGNLGVLPTLYNLEENFDFYMVQVGNAPTAVRLASFGATPAAGGVLVNWETAGEHDNAGFNLYRSVTVDDRGVQLNPALIPSASPGGDQGASYAFLDAAAVPGVTYYYTLEDVDLAGNRTVHGPVAFTLWRVYLPLVR